MAGRLDHERGRGRRDARRRRLAPRPGRRHLYRRAAGQALDVAWPSAEVVVTFVAGFADTAAVPAALRQIAASLARTFAALPSRDPSIASETVVGVHSITYVAPVPGEADGLPPLIARMLRAGGFVDFRSTRED